MIKKELTYKGHKLYIAKHPDFNHYLSYAVVPPKEYSEDEILDLDVHGGITYEGYLKHIGKPDEFALGIDFAHAGDYSELMPDLNGHKWTEEEVIKEAMQIVDEYYLKLEA